MNQSSNIPLVSIIINCYNGEIHLRDCIKSILSQTYKNWELIFWDNQSEDGSETIFKSYKDKRFKYFKANSHTSLYKARNFAIKKANGELLSFIDVDDLWENNKLELQVELFNDPKISLVYSNLWIIKNKLKNKKIFQKKDSPSGFIYKKLLNEYNIGIITVIFRKSIIKSISKIFDERFSIIGDFEFFLRLSKSYYFHYINTPLAYYRIHDKNYSSLHVEKEMEEIDIWLKENKNEISHQQLKKIKKQTILRKLLHLKFNKNYKNCFKILMQNYTSFIIFKMLIIIFTPIYILKKVSRFHI
tara:strand:- start:3574 stop:4479 length:906 start_codon:yes stop_codon:yes gene_type:complete